MQLAKGSKLKEVKVKETKSQIKRLFIFENYLSFTMVMNASCFTIDNSPFTIHNSPFTI